MISNRKGTMPLRYFVLTIGMVNVFWAILNLKTFLATEKYISSLTTTAYVNYQHQNTYLLGLPHEYAGLVFVFEGVIMLVISLLSFATAIYYFKGVKILNSGVILGIINSLIGVFIFGAAGAFQIILGIVIYWGSLKRIREIKGVK